jgi:hypothetical protein
MWEEHKLYPHRVTSAHHTPRGHKRGNTDTAPRILNFGTRQSGEIPALALITEEPLLPTEREVR